MATSLDEAMEHFFDGWTPAPPAPDHDSFHCSSYSQHLRHRVSAQRQSKGSTNLPPAQAAQAEEEAAAPSSQKAGTGSGDGWDEWESPFQSRSNSPDVENQSPNDPGQADTGIAAWRAYSPSRRHCQAATEEEWGAVGSQQGCQVKHTSPHGLQR